MQSNIENFYWIGGCPSGGKTTLANELSKANNITVYHIDNHLLEYGLRINSMVPAYHEEINMNFVESTIKIPDEPWFDIFITGLKGLCSIVLDDVTKLFADNTVIIEGGILLPEFISETGIVGQTIFVNPTYEHLHEYLPKQKWVINILSQLDDEYKSLFINKLLHKYNLFREYVIEGAKKFGIKSVTTDPDSLEKNINIVSKHFLIMNKIKSEE